MLYNKKYFHHKTSFFLSKGTVLLIGWNKIVFSSQHYLKRYGIFLTVIRVYSYAMQVEVNSCSGVLTKEVQWRKFCWLDLRNCVQTPFAEACCCNARCSLNIYATLFFKSFKSLLFWPVELLLTIPNESERWCKTFNLFDSPNLISLSYISSSVVV